MAWLSGMMPSYYTSSILYSIVVQYVLKDPSAYSLLLGAFPLGGACDHAVAAVAAVQGIWITRPPPGVALRDFLWLGA